MIKPVLVASALCLAFATTAMAQSGMGASKSQPSAIQKCDGLTGEALEKCKREAAPGRSENAASRAGDKSPGASGDATSRTGTPPGSSAAQSKK